MKKKQIYIYILKENVKVFPNEDKSLIAKPSARKIIKRRKEEKYEKLIEGYCKVRRACRPVINKQLPWVKLGR